MKSVVCTLFEGHYEIGLAAFLNSLVKSDFKGAVVAGYRGPLPKWASPYRTQGNCTDFKLTDDITVRFLLLDTKTHFGNFKPDLMLAVLESYVPDASAIFYFDPDITIQCKWVFFEQWVQAGVALCTDVNGDLSENHPLRKQWVDYFAKAGIELKVPRRTYFNSGFVGIEQKHKAFIETWRDLQKIAWRVKSDEDLITGDRTFLFHMPDQDVLNAATMCAEIPLSWVGKDGMGFEPGGYVMAHAIGAPKPWKKKMLGQAILRGRFPSYVDKHFYSNVRVPLSPFSPLELLVKKLDLLVAAALGRYLS